MADDKDGMGFITAITDTYLRGSNIGSAFSPTILIVDEAQNFPEFALRKVLTRACEGTKVIVIGHTLQCDLKAEKSGLPAARSTSEKRTIRSIRALLSVNCITAIEALSPRSLTKSGMTNNFR